MIIASLTEGEFLKLSSRYQHKRAATLLRDFIESRSQRTLLLYRRVEEWMQLPSIKEKDFKILSDRYHLHLDVARLSWQEHNLLTPFNREDTPSDATCLDAHIYLDNLRSAFNVGSILRTTEAFRLGSVYFSPFTPFIDNEKVQKASMMTFDKVKCHQAIPINEMPRPLIALETSDKAPSLLDFAFPPRFTLMLGNEEYGLSEEALKQADQVVTIPLFGFKNSLNVASAFAIAAAVISHQLRKNEKQ